MIQNHLLLATTLVFTGAGHAADIATDISAGSGGYDNSNGGYFEFGVGLNLIGDKEAIRAWSSILLAGAYRYRGFFFEAINPGISLNDGNAGVGGLTVGVNLWRNDQWALDFVGASTTWIPTNSGRDTDDSDTEIPESDQEVFDRDSFYSGAGARLTGYFGDTILQFRLVDDLYDGNGITGSARIGHSWQVKNWNLHGVVGVNHTSQETSQYWYGVSADEASDFLPQYDVGSSTFSISAEIGATYPVREHVVFRSTAQLTQIDEKVTKSPLQEDDLQFRWKTSLSYVF